MNRRNLTTLAQGQIKSCVAPYLSGIYSGLVRLRATRKINSEEDNMSTIATVFIYSTSLLDPIFQTIGPVVT